MVGFLSASGYGPICGDLVWSTLGARPPGDQDRSLPALPTPRAHQTPVSSQPIPRGPAPPPGLSQEQGGSVGPDSDLVPIPAANITIFRPTSFFVLVHTGLGLQLQVQLVPLMQLFLRLEPSYRGQMCGEAGWVGSGAAGPWTQQQAACAGVWQGVGIGRELLPGNPASTCGPREVTWGGGWTVSHAVLTRAGFAQGLTLTRAYLQMALEPKSWDGALWLVSL